MVDNVLWIITDDQMRWTLSRMPKTRKRLVRKGVEFSADVTKLSRRLTLLRQAQGKELRVREV